MRRKHIVAFALLTALFACLFPIRALSEEYGWADGGEKFYTVNLESGEALFSVGGAVYTGDEYIASDNKRYKVMRIDDENYTAVAMYDGDEEMPNIDWLKNASVDFSVAASTGGGKNDANDNNNNKGDKKVAIYSTHTDESYVPTDGTSSKDSGGGILDVAKALKSSFEKLGVKADIDTTSHLPHDNGAYRRSRQTAAKLMEKLPDALIDVHRDGIPNANEYNEKVNGKNVTAVRLLVGRSNQNSAANREFAKEVKAVADHQYPGLVKDIFIGKGTYNQDLTPNAILLEFGTHTTSKERAIASTDMIATAITSVLYGSGSAAGGRASSRGNSGVGKGIIALLIFVVVAAVVFAFLQTGTGRGMWDKLKRGTSEVTGGLVGKKPHEGEGEGETE